MNCPRCQQATDDASVSCASCGAPLLIGDEPPPAPLDRVIDLDRRLGPMMSGVEPAGDFAVMEPALGRDEPAVEEPAPETAEAAMAGTHVSIARRATAAALDATLVAAFGAVPILVAARGFPRARAFEALFPAAAALVALLGFTYAVLGHALMGATVGKWLLGLRVTGPGGTPPGLARSAARGAVAVIGTAGLGLGMLVGLFTRSGRALHDVVAGTSVVSVVDPSHRGA